MKLDLEDIEKVNIGENNIFFIESSPKEVLSSREGCALESASRNSELHVIMVRVGKTLDLTDNTTCQIYTRSVLFKELTAMINATFLDLETQYRCTLLIQIIFHRILHFKTFLMVLLWKEVGTGKSI